MVLAAHNAPLAPGLPILGSALKMRLDPLRYLLSLYQQYGPVFRLNAAVQGYTVMAGIEANRFLAREAGEYLHSRDVFGDFAQEFGSTAFLTAIDGEAHRHQRKVQRRGYSREAILSRLSDVIRVARDTSATWKAGDTLTVLPTFQRMVTDQLSTLLTGHPSGAYFDDLRTFLSMNMNVNVMKTYPKFMLRLPHYRKSRQRVIELSSGVIAQHRDNPTTEREPDLIDDLLCAYDEAGQPYSPETVLAAAIGPYIAGMDTVASTASFMLYAVLKHPEVAKRVQAEVDAEFAKGALTAESFRAMHTLHNAAIETLRLYPVGAFTPRTVEKPYEFGGYTFEPGTQVLVANGITHLMAEYYPDPDKFDVDRYSRPDQPKVAQAFSPYTLGPHTCLGAGMAEVQLMTVIATLMHHFDFELPSPDFEITVYATPIPNPGRKFSVKVLRRRH